MVTTMIPAGLLMAFWRGRMRDEVELPLPPDELPPPLPPLLLPPLLPPLLPLLLPPLLLPELDPLPLLLLPLDEDESLLCKVSSVKKGTKK
jgi:hypothetical protein